MTASDLSMPSPPIRRAPTPGRPATRRPKDAAPRPDGRDARLMRAARELEASFLAQMLKSAGLGKTREAFGGGAGEDQFSSFLVQEQARAMVKAGGIGLAQTIFEALKQREDNNV